MTLQDALRRVAEPLGEAISLTGTTGAKVPAPGTSSGPDRGPRPDCRVLGSEPDRSLARWLIRRLAVETGAVPASIHDLYMARGRARSGTISPSRR